MKKILTLILLLAFLFQIPTMVLATEMGVEKAAELAELVAKTPAEKEFLDYIVTFILRDWGPNGQSYADWLPEEKKELIRQLVKSEYLPANDQISQLLHGQMEDAFISDFVDKTLVEWMQLETEKSLDLEAPRDNSAVLIGFNSIIQKIWGYDHDWTHEQKAWRNQAWRLVDMNDYDIYAVPESKHIPEKTAARFARNALEIWLGELPGTFQGDMYTEFRIFEEYNLDEKGMPIPVWHFLLGELNGIHDVSVDSLTGMIYDEGLRWSVRAYRNPKGEQHTLNEGEGIFSELEFSLYPTTQFRWSLEAKAEWSKTIRPAVLELEKTGPGSFDYATIAFSQYAYGLPDESAMSEEKALQISKEAIVQTGILDAEKLELYNSVYTYYDVTNMDQPKWRFHFSAYGPNADLLSDYYLPNLMNIRIEVDAHTGEILSLEKYRQGDYTGYDAILKWL